jgi:hypothetical protein
MPGKFTIEFEGEPDDVHQLSKILEYLSMAPDKDDALILKLSTALQKAKYKETRPTFWPPQAGDVWEDLDGVWWFARSVTLGVNMLSYDHMVVDAVIGLSTEPGQKRFLERKPKLMFRRAEGGGIQWGRR